MTNKNLILFFIKYPEKGKVKTRLAADIGEEKATELYKLFILTILKTLTSLPHDIRICFTPKDKEEQLKQWLGNQHDYYAQQGGDLGKRMTDAFENACKENYEKVLVIGSDSPDLTEKIFSEAFEALNKHDAVIGPTFDGGYYLLGFRKETFYSGVFDGIEWSTERVFEETMGKLKTYNCEIHVLKKLRDVDTKKDMVI